MMWDWIVKRVHIVEFQLKGCPSKQDTGQIERVEIWTYCKLWNSPIETSGPAGKSIPDFDLLLFHLNSAQISPFCVFFISTKVLISLPKVISSKWPKLVVVMTPLTELAYNTCFFFFKCWITSPETWNNQLHIILTFSVHLPLWQPTPGDLLWNSDPC